jgi:hypothetical protein
VHVSGEFYADFDYLKLLDVDVILLCHSSTRVDLRRLNKKDVKQIKTFSSCFSNDCPLGGWPPKGRPWDIFAPLHRDFSTFRHRDLGENGRTLQSGRASGKYIHVHDFNTNM